MAAVVKREGARASFLALIAAFGLGLSLDVVTYNSPGNTGIVIRLRELPVCVGLEVRGHPGVFGGNYAEYDV
jgi:hypothetical protein